MATTAKVLEQSVLIAPDGKTTQVNPAGKYFTLKELYKLIDTDIIEVLRLGDTHLAIFCEEGKLRDKPLNAAGTLAAKLLGWVPVPGDGGLVGNVLICPADKMN